MTDTKFKQRQQKLMKYATTLAGLGEEAEIIVYVGHNDPANPKPYWNQDVYSKAFTMDASKVLTAISELNHSGYECRLKIAYLSEDLSLDNIQIVSVDGQDGFDKAVSLFEAAVSA